eukprot:1195601-Prorocentrum_minimum.AAC.4
MLGGGGGHAEHAADAPVADVLELDDPKLAARCPCHLALNLPGVLVAARTVKNPSGDRKKRIFVKRSGSRLTRTVDAKSPSAGAMLRRLRQCTARRVSYTSTAHPSIPSTVCDSSKESDDTILYRRSDAYSMCLLNRKQSASGSTRVSGELNSPVVERLYKGLTATESSGSHVCCSQLRGKNGHKTGRGGAVPVDGDRALRLRAERPHRTERSSRRL